ncbi:MAG: PAS domain S-box protein, partial [Alkalispirochaeta sp.]
MSRSWNDVRTGIATITVIVAVLTILVTGFYLDQRRSREQSETLNQLLAVHEVAWRAVRSQYATTVQTYFDELLDGAVTAEYIAAALDDETRDDARAETYRSLYPQYETLRARGIETLQFVLPDGEVLLRFHQPDRYGDRVHVPSTHMEAGKTWATNCHFTVGRTVSGFRYSFPVPLSADRPLWGSVEIGLPFEMARRELSRLLPDHDFQLLLRRRVVEESVFEDHQRLYGAWPGSEGFLVQDPHRILPGSPHPLSPQSEAVVAAASESESVQDALRSTSSSAIPLVSGDYSYALVLIAVQDRRDRPVGFVASYAAVPQLGRSDRAFFIGIVLTVVLVIIFSGTAYGLLRAVTQRLHERRRLRTITETIGEGLYVMDMTGVITDINGRAAELLGYDRSKLLGREAHALFHEHTTDGQDTSLQQCPIFRTILTGDEYRGENLFRRGDGTPLPVWVVSRPITTSDEITGSVTSFSDLSGEKRTMARLRTLSLAVEQSPESIMITDDHGRIEYVNEAFLITTGYEEQDVLGRNPRVLKSGRTDPQVFREMWQRLASGESWRGELVNRRKDGSEYEEEAILSPIVSDEGETMGYLAIKQDITHRKRNERELEHRLAENQILLREVHHRVRNNLTVIASLLNVQSTAIASPEDAIAAFEKTRDRVMSMALVHDVLHRSDDFTSLDAEEYVKQLVGHLQQVHTNAPDTEVSYSIFSTCLRPEIAVPVGLIITELVSNTLRHA